MGRFATVVQQHSATHEPDRDRTPHEVSEVSANVDDLDPRVWSAALEAIAPFPSVSRFAMASRIPSAASLYFVAAPVSPRRFAIALASQRPRAAVMLVYAHDRSRPFQCVSQIEESFRKSPVAGSTSATSASATFADTTGQLSSASVVSPVSTS